MENIIIKPTEETPSVDFNFTESRCLISGRSLPENAMSFYEPLIDWLNNYSKSEKDSITFNMKLDYFNTASAKQVTKILIILQCMAESKKTEINWFYLEGDEDIKQSGTRFARLIDANINLVEYKN